MKQNIQLNLTKEEEAGKGDSTAESDLESGFGPNGFPEANPPEGLEPVALSAKEIIERPIKVKPPVVDNLMDDRDSLLITGTTGIGKTLLAGEIGMYIAQGRNLFDKEAFYISQPRRVLFVQSEISIKNMQFRLKTQAQELEVAEDTLHRIFLPWENNDVRVTGDLLNGFADSLIRYITKYNIEVVILDPLISYHSANENDNVQVRKALDTITKVSTSCSVSTIICHHHGKIDLEGHHAARGASAIADWASTILTLKNNKSNENVSVEISKVRNFESTPGFTLKKERGSLAFRLAVTEKEVRVPAIKKILAEAGGMLKSQNALNKLVQKELGVSSRTGLIAIQEAIETGDIIVEVVEGKKNQKQLSVAPGNLQ
jgi:hypothetical protein